MRCSGRAGRIRTGTLLAEAQALNLVRLLFRHSSLWPRLDLPRGSLAHRGGRSPDELGGNGKGPGDRCHARCCRVPFPLSPLYTPVGDRGESCTPTPLAGPCMLSAVRLLFRHAADGGGRAPCQGGRGCICGLLASNEARRSLRSTLAPLRAFLMRSASHQPGDARRIAYECTTPLGRQADMCVQRKNDTSIQHSLGLRADVKGRRRGILGRCLHNSEAGPRGEERR